MTARADAPLARRAVLLLRGPGLLVAAGLAFFVVPTALALVVLGGPFGWRHVLIGLASGVVLLALSSAALGWAVGGIATGRASPPRTRR